jgi:hypothetical protein
MKKKFWIIIGLVLTAIIMCSCAQPEGQERVVTQEPERVPTEELGVILTEEPEITLPEEPEVIPTEELEATPTEEPEAIPTEEPEATPTEEPETMPTEEPEHSAMVIETVEKVDAHPRPQDEWESASVGMIVYGGGQVRTGSASSARLELLEGIVRLAADTLFTVKESITRQETLVTTLFLGGGQLWANLTTDQPHDFTVETASAVVAVRDTCFSVKVDPDQTTFVSTSEGEVVLTAQGESVTLTPGQQAMVEPGQPPTLLDPMSDEERDLCRQITENELSELAPTPTPTPTCVLPTEPEDIAFKAEDGQELMGTYYPPPLPSPLTVVYFPWVRGDRHDWNTLVTFLPQPPSDGVFSITARGCEEGCGEDWDRADWLLDYPAALHAAKELPCADQNQLVTIGSSVGADGAIYACGKDERCIGALAFSPKGYLDIPYADEVAFMVEQGKYVWAVSAQSDSGALRLDHPEWSDYYHEIILPGEAHGNQLYNPFTGQLIQDFMECATQSFALEKCAAISITLPPGPPTIISIDFPNQIPIDGSSLEGVVRFRDSDGDINWATFDVVSSVNFTPFEFKPLWSLVEGDATDGAFTFNIQCETAQQVTLRVTLHDTAGNSSAPVDFSFSCQ